MRDLFDDFMEELRKREAAARGEQPDKAGSPRRPDPDAVEPDEASADDDADEAAVDDEASDPDGEAADTDADDEAEEADRRGASARQTAPTPRAGRTWRTP